ncbi:hypothetical protein D049_4899B, partial [Vibrio parahaemolyticus VPTS-2010]
VSALFSSRAQLDEFVLSPLPSDAVTSALQP